MSSRVFKVFGKTFSDGIFNVLIHSTYNDKFLCIKSNALITIDNNVGQNLKKSYQTLADGYGLMGVLRFYDGNSYLILITGVFSVGQLYGCDVHKVTSVQFISLYSELIELSDQRIVELQRFLSSGIFYYASSSQRQNFFNLTMSSQKRHEGKKVDNRFFWNRNLCFIFERYGICIDDWLVKCMCGSVLIRTIYVGHRTSKVAIISRLSCERVGTRFNVRGTNDDGNVANFVETEQLLTFEDIESSFVQIRGSIPLFWEQPGINVGSHKIKLKPLEISIPALQKHYDQLKNLYGSILTLNLLGSKEGERLLSNAFQTALKTSFKANMALINFDYHFEIKHSKNSIKSLLKKLDSTIIDYQFFTKLSDNIKEQKGVIRTNCLDCLDRTNNVQLFIGLKVLTLQIAALKMEQYKTNISGRFEEVIKDLWVKNGDQCSVIYAGTGALDGKSKLKDASRSIARTIQNNLMDTSKQESFDLLLLGSTFGNKIFDKASNLLPIKIIKECPNEVEAFVEREKEMCVPEELLVFVGTWNVNGGKNMYNVAFRHEQSLNLWIFPNGIFSSDELAYDIIAIGLEEIVDLNASNLVKASTTNQRVWRDGIKKTIDEYFEHHKYVVLACEQLVGVCIIIFIRSNLLSKMRDLSCEKVKTGMGGATGNKGSIVVRFTINATSVCFVCSHFAAGQNEVMNRNEDFQATVKKIRFPLDRTIDSHDVIFWFGDFNYRISLNGDEVKNKIKMRDFEYLYQHDQLIQQRMAEKVFVNYKEGVLNFAPTYKYDTFSDDYDTSEKCRAPAWTDRILWNDSKELVQLLSYGRSELKTSDHRPVSAIFKLKTLKVVPKKCEKVISDIVCSLGPPDSTILCYIENEKFTQQLYNSVFQKLHELAIPVLLHKITNDTLEIIVQNGLEALASLSMDKIPLYDESGNVKILSVALKSINWAENRMEKMLLLFKESQTSQCDSLMINVSRLFDEYINLEDDEDEIDAIES